MAEVSFRIDPIHLEQMNRRIGEYLGIERQSMANLVDDLDIIEALGPASPVPADDTERGG